MEEVFVPAGIVDPYPAFAIGELGPLGPEDRHPAAFHGIRSDGFLFKRIIARGPPRSRMSVPGLHARSFFCQGSRPDLASFARDGINDYNDLALHHEFIHYGSGATQNRGRKTDQPTRHGESDLLDRALMRGWL
jgi:hypothetical protein